MKFKTRLIVTAVSAAVCIGGFQSLVFAGKEKKAAPRSNSRAHSELEIGAAAPMTGRKMMDVSGKELSLADVKGKKGLLVIFP